MKIYIFLMVGLTFLLSSCENDTPDTPIEKGTRTVLAYLMADNTLSSFSSADIDEMVEGMKQVNTSECNLLVYVDGKDSSPVLYHIYKDMKGKVQKEAIKNYEEQISTDATVLQEVMQRAFSEYPADSYGLVIWSHGNGWIPKPFPEKKGISTRWIGEDDTDGIHYLNITDMAAVFETMPHLDFILFDACFGQTIEVAYELRKYADYIIGSPTEIPAPGAPYDKVVPAMFSSESVGKKIGEAYYRPYADNFDENVVNNPAAPWEDGYNGKWISGASVSVVNCAALEELASVTKQLLSSTAPDLSTLHKSNIFNYNKLFGNNCDYFDMKQLMQYLLVDVSAWNSAFANAIIYWSSTPLNFSDFAGCFPLPQDETCGLSHYIPLSTTSATSDAYRSTAWYKAAGLSKLNW